MELTVNGWRVEIKEENNIHYPAGYWKTKRVYIYDPKQAVGRNEIVTIIQYLYDEAFIEDRRTEYEVITKT